MENIFDHFDFMIKRHKFPREYTKIQKDISTLMVDLLDPNSAVVDYRIDHYFDKEYYLRGYSNPEDAYININSTASPFIKDIKLKIRVYD